MQLSANQNLILIEGAATYERILTDVRELEVDEGLRHIKDFIKIYPDFARAHNDLAVMYYQAGNSLKALAHYEKAHKLDPANIIYRKNLADFYFVELEWTGDAIHTYLDILKENPFDTEVLNSLGTISLELGRKEQARQYFNRTIQLDPTNHYAQQGLQQLPALIADQAASRHFQQTPCQAGQTADSTQCPPVSATFQSLFNMVPPQPTRSPEELYKEAMMLVNTGKSSDAIQILETLVAQNANHALAHNDLGVLYQKAGDLQKSCQQHERAVQLEPGNIVFQKNLADLLCGGFGDFEQALKIYVNLFAENRYDVEILKAIAHICLKVDKMDDARFFLEQIMTLKPWDQEASETLRAIKESSLGISC